jgi:predicted  nucleic acid-binding Zn-ribbon protein
MNPFRRPTLALALMAASILMVSTACKREDPQIRELTQKAAEADKANQQLNQAGAEQQKKLAQAGVNDIRPNAETLQLTDDQKKALEERIKNEKNSSYQALLQEVLDKDKDIKDLNSKLAKLKADLPKPDIARPNDSHYGMALRFLKKKGVPEAEAKKLVSRVAIMEKLAPGFEVYHFYANGTYGTWVAQGHAKITPNDLTRQEREKVEGERDEAVAQNEKLQEEVTDLESQKQKITEEIAGLQTERANLIEERTKLQADNTVQLAKLNSLHYVVGVRDALKSEGVIEIPVFAKDRAGKNWRDEVFTQSLDLRTGKSITIKAADLGLKKIGKVNVVPGSYLKDEHYKLTISADKQSATVELITVSRFKNDKVVFAVTD